jgi:putative glycosyltransferase (TIGR04372 family)
MPIIENELAYQIVEKMCSNPGLRRFSPFEELPFEPNAYYEFNNTERNLYFTDAEEEEGKRLLKKMGISENSWFVCFHSRDPAYLSTQFKFDSSYHDFRDCDIKNYLKAAKYITDSGGFAVRVGSVVAEKLPDMKNPRIIDYASYYRTDFGDIYLPAKCKFFLGSSAGLLCVPYIFHVPVAMANYIPMSVAPSPRKGDLFIPMKIWSVKEKRFLTFREILESGVADYLYSEQYAEAGVTPVENTADEILDLAIEMNERLDGAFETTEEDEELQKKFHSLFKPHHHCYGTPVRIGTKFLRENKELLE